MKPPEIVSTAQKSWVMKRKGAASDLMFGTGDRILFLDAVPVAVIAGGFGYVCDQMRSGAETRHINEFTAGCPQVRTSSDNFDFTLGAVLTKAGLPLTRRSE